MQQRRLRPGDVLDDYCPRERRITDHAIVAMIDDEIKQTRCVSCDAEHEYKQAKVPPQRRKKAPAALFTQVLDGLQTGSARSLRGGVEGPGRLAPNAGAAPEDDIDVEVPAVAAAHPPTQSEGTASRVPSQPTEVPRDEQADASAGATPDDASTSSGPPRARSRGDRLRAPSEVEGAESREQGQAARDTADGSEPAQDTDPADEGSVRRPLIRAQLPRPEGQQPPARDLPDFTIRQPSSSRGHRPAGHGPRGRRRGGGQQQGQGGAMRFGNQGRSNEFGRPGERRHGGGGGRHGQGQGQGPGHGQGRGRSQDHNRGGRRGGKKH